MVKRFDIAELQKASGVTQRSVLTARATVTTQEPNTKAVAERIGAYLSRDEYQAMRSAYMADVDNLPTGPNSMGEWVARALQDHARKSPKRREALRNDPTQVVPASGDPTGEKRQMKSWPAEPDTMHQVKAAMTADRTAGLPAQSVSQWAADAIRAAIATARTRNGGTLPPPPVGRTPKNPRP